MYKDTKKYFKKYWRQLFGIIVFAFLGFLIPFFSLFAIDNYKEIFYTPKYLSRCMFDMVIITSGNNKEIDKYLPIYNESTGLKSLNDFKECDFTEEEKNAGMQNIYLTNENLIWDFYNLNYQLDKFDRYEYKYYEDSDKEEFLAKGKIELKDLISEEDFAKINSASDLRLMSRKYSNNLEFEKEKLKENSTNSNLMKSKNLIYNFAEKSLASENPVYKFFYYDGYMNLNLPIFTTLFFFILFLIIFRFTCAKKIFPITLGLLFGNIVLVIFMIFVLLEHFL